MKLVDVNVLLYAIDERSERHRAALNWLERALSGETRVLFPWIVTVAFLRIATGSAYFANPLSMDDAIGVMSEWLENPAAVVAVPDGDHFERLGAMLREAGRAGDLVSDAHIAAIAEQYDAPVVSFDSDFARFAAVRWEQPA